MLTYSLNAPVAGLTLNADGSYSFTPAMPPTSTWRRAPRTDVVANYTVTDEHGATRTATLTITLTGTNDAPVAVADTNSGQRGRAPSPARSRPTTATSMTARA